MARCTSIAPSRSIGRCSDGLLYPRWFPDLAYGYGFPFFNYREPFGYYLVELVHLLGASLPLALNLVLAGSLIASGLTMNLWVSDIFDRPAGFVAAIVYMAAPYTVIDSLVRGNLPEAIALALMPLILWAFRRLLLRGGRKYFALAVLSLAALLLTHNISSLIFVPVLIVYIFVLRSAYSRKERADYSLLITRYAIRFHARPRSHRLLLAARPRRRPVRAVVSHAHPARGNDYHFNFATAAEVFGPPGSVGSGAAQSAAAHRAGLGADVARRAGRGLDQTPRLTRTARARHHRRDRRRDLHLHGAAHLAARCGTRCR